MILSVYRFDSPEVQLAMALDGLGLQDDQLKPDRNASCWFWWRSMHLVKIYRPTDADLRNDMAY